MSPLSAAAPSHRLYSQVEHDERGNFEYRGDLLRPGLDLPALTLLIQQHLEKAIAGARFSVTGERFAGGRKIIAGVIDATEDLSSNEARHGFEVAVRDQIKRFGVVRSNVLQDVWNCSFFCNVVVTDAYWALLSARRGKQNLIEQIMSLTAFKRAVKVGDRLKLAAAPQGHRALGMIRPIVAVRSADLILEGPSYLTFPKATAFACDGEKIRIGIGHSQDPDAHLLYEWIRAAA